VVAYRFEAGDGIGIGPGGVRRAVIAIDQAVVESSPLELAEGASVGRGQDLGAQISGSIGRTLQLGVALGRSLAWFGTLS